MSEQQQKMNTWKWDTAERNVQKGGSDWNLVMGRAWKNYGAEDGKV